MERLNRNMETMNEKHAQLDAKLLASQKETEVVDTVFEDHTTKLDINKDSPIGSGTVETGSSSGLTVTDEKQGSISDEIMRG